MMVWTLESRDHEDAPWRFEYTQGRRAPGGGERDYDWLGVVWTDDWNTANARDRVREANGGRFDDHHYRIVQLEFDPEKHSLIAG